MHFPKTILRNWNIRVIRVCLSFIVLLSSFKAISQEPAWWTQQKRDCGLSPSLAYETWKAQGEPCNRGGTPISAQERAENRQAHQHAHANTYNDKAISLVKEGKYGSAIKYYQKALKHWPGNQTIRQNLERAISYLSDDVIDRDKTTDKSWWKSLHKPFKFHEWADIWADKENQNSKERLKESTKLSNEATQLADQGNFKESYNKLNAALEIDPDNGSVIQGNIQSVKNAEVMSLNKEMLEVSKSDYETALLKAREASLVDPNNPITKENLNKIEVQELIKEAKDAKAIDANDLALDKLNKALEKNPGNTEIQKSIDSIQRDIEFEKNRIKYSTTGLGKLDGQASKNLTSISEDKKIFKDNLLTNRNENGFDNPKQGGAITPPGNITIPTPYDLPEYKKLDSDIKLIQDKYKVIAQKIEANHAKMKDPDTKPEELEQLVKETKAMKVEIESSKVEVVKKKEEKEELVKKFYIKPIGN